MNPNGGQVFIEIDFKEAVDYERDTGLLSINESILFWKYPKKVAPLIKGVSYMVTKVTSTFDNGKFIQDIDAVINTFPDDEATQSPTSSSANRENQSNAETARLARQGTGSGPAPGASNSTTTNTGLAQDPPVTTPASVTGQTPVSSTQSATQTANDDGGP